MLKFRQLFFRSLLVAGIAAGIVATPAPAQAMGLNENFHSDSDSGLNTLDFIENAARHARKYRLSPEETKLKKDVAEMKARLTTPLPSTITDEKQLPIAMEGDELFYDQLSGDVFARGNVVITRIDEKRLTAPAMDGNIKRQEAKSDDKTDFYQTTPGEQRITLHGYRTIYNWGEMIGEMEDVTGRVDDQFIKGQRIEIYPDEVIIYNGVASYCSAKRPDYCLKAKKVEIWRDTIIMHDVSYWIRDMKVGYKKRIVRDLTEKDKDHYMPELGYSKKYGVWIADRFFYEVFPGLTANADIFVGTKHGGRNRYSLNYGQGWRGGGFNVGVEDGKFDNGTSGEEDSDDAQPLKKRHNVYANFSQRLGKSPFSVSAYFEQGHWKQMRQLNHNWVDRKSIHRAYGASLSMNTIQTRHLSWVNSIGYSNTHESYDNSTTRGLTVSSTLLFPIGDRVYVYANYSHSKDSNESSLFNYDNDNFDRMFKHGISWQITPNDRIAFGRSVNARDGRLDQIDYYWFHQLHCAQLIFNYNVDHYRHDRSFNVDVAFTPW